MKTQFANPHFVRSALGALFVALCGLGLWHTPLGESWVNASYDHLFRFNHPAGSNQVVFVAMDNEAFDHLEQTRGQPWDRNLHTQLLNKLADDGCALVVFDIFFRRPQDPGTDAALAEAMRRQRALVLMAEQAEVTHPTLAGVRPTLPAEIFLTAAQTNWGVAWVSPDVDATVRQPWPAEFPGPYPSLPEVAARLKGVTKTETTSHRWMRYYDRETAWATLSYPFALTQAPGFFRDKIVFIGIKPKTSVVDGEPEEFRTPHTRWTGESAAGAEIMITSFLNIVNGDELRRPAKWLEGLLLVGTGVLLGSLLRLAKLRMATGSAIAIAALSGLAGIMLSHLTNFWFPWLVIAAGQVPVAWMWAVATRSKVSVAQPVEETIPLPTPALQPALAHANGHAADIPAPPDYEVFNPPFGRGAYGKVWLVRNAIGQWQALKAVYRASFDDNPEPYEREFGGISRYKPVSDKHPGLLRVDFVSRKRDDYFYYVMELGDPLEPGWEKEPTSYKPRDLVNERARSKGRRLPIQECLRIGLSLTDALEFLHRQGLTHRDIKPQNIIFVNGQPKLADVGLIGRIRPPGEAATSVGTPGYLPPAPEPPGTPQADIYALGMMLYVLSTGQNPAFFPEIATTLVASNGQPDFFPLNRVILKACQPDCAERYSTAAEMHRALANVQRLLNHDTTAHAVLANDLQH